MKIFKVIVFISLSILVSCHQDRFNNNEIAAIVGQDTIYIEEVDARIQQILFEKLNDIYFARKTYLNYEINEHILNQFIKTKGISKDSLISYLYSIRTYDSLYEQFMILNHYDSIIPSFGRTLTFDKTRSEIGLKKSYDIFNKLIEQKLVDELKLNTSIKILIQKPSIPRVLLEHIDILYLNSKVLQNKLLLVTDPECSNCLQFHTKFKELYKKYNKKITFGVVFYSSSVNDKIKLIYSEHNPANKMRIYEYFFNEARNNRNTNFMSDIIKYCTIDTSKIMSNYNSYTTYKKVENDFDQLRRIGIVMTPTLILNGQILSFRLDFDSLELNCLKKISN